MTQHFQILGVQLGKIAPPVVNLPELTHLFRDGSTKRRGKTKYPPKELLYSVIFTDLIECCA